jgi:hypothetical protein
MQDSAAEVVQAQRLYLPSSNDDTNTNASALGQNPSQVVRKMVPGWLGGFDSLEEKTVQ